MGLSLLLLAQSSFGQDSAGQKKLGIQEMLNSREFVFRAQFANPMRGPSRPLTTPYELKIDRDTLTSNLPYFGRVYAAPINPTRSVLDFVSHRFSYKWTTPKKGRWELTIKIEDNQDVQQFFLTVFDNGSGTLSVTFSSRDGISFNGYLQQSDKPR